MAAEMLLDLALRLRQKREIPAVSSAPGHGADGESARVPQRVEQARPAAELADALGAPRRWSSSSPAPLECLARDGVARSERLPWYSAWAHTSPTWFTRISAAACMRSSSVISFPTPAAGEGRYACATPATARKARSNSPIRRSRRSWDEIHPAGNYVLVLGGRDHAVCGMREVRRPDERAALLRLESVLALVHSACRRRRSRR